MSSLNIHEQHLTLANRVVSALVEREQPPADLSGIWLFGSVARGTDVEQSDIDVIVTHSGSEEAFPFSFINAVLEALEKAQIPCRPSRTRRSEKYPGSVHVTTRSEGLFQNPDSIRADDFSSERSWMNTANFWEKVRAEAVKLYPTESLDQLPPVIRSPLPWSTSTRRGVASTGQAALH